MMIRHEGVLFFLVNPVKHYSAANTHKITHLDGSRLYTYSQKCILFMIPVADEFVQSNHKPAVIRKTYLQRQARSFFHEPYVCHLAQEKVTITAFAIFLDTTVQHTK